MRQHVSARALRAASVALAGAAAPLLGTASLRADVYGTAVATDGPAGYWRLGEAAGAGTAANDPAASGGSTMNGTYNPSPTLGQPGIPGAVGNSAAVFSGAGDVVRDIAESTVATAYTLEAWVRPSAAITQGIIVNTSEAGTGSDWAHNLRIIEMNGTCHMSFYVYDGGAKGFIASAPVTVGELYHVVGVASNDGPMQLYVNGVQQGGTYYLEGNVSEEPLAVGSLWDGPIWNIGSNTAGNSRDPFSQDYFHGMIDEVAIYPTVLDPYTIAEHHTIGAGGAPAHVWTGGNGNWNNAAKWTGGDLPGNTVRAHVDFGNAAASSVAVTQDAAVGGVILDAGDTLAIDAGRTLTLAGPSASLFNGTLQNSGTLAVTGGRTRLAQTGTHGGAFVVSSGATLEFAGGTLTATTVHIDGGRVALLPGGNRVLRVNTLEIAAAGGTLDLADNDLIVDYAGVSVEGQVRQWVKDGRAGAASGILSTPGDPDDDKVLAVADNANLNRTAWLGVAIDTTTVIGKYTFFGDANLDGKVTGDDYLNVDANLGTGDSWLEGDFNMNGTTTGDDYLAIDANLGKGSPNPLAYAELKQEMVSLHAAMFGEEYLGKLAAVEANGFGASVVPEPSCAMLMATGLLVRARRRRRR